jgi:hypothetical protein
MQIRYLDVRSTRITDAGLRTYLNSPNSSSLEYLDISYLGAGITNATIEALSLSDHCKHLVVLKCKNSRIGNEALVDLAESENALHIEELDLSVVRDEKKTKPAIRRNDTNLFQHSNTKEFSNDTQCISDKGIDSLSRAKYLGSMEILNLSG